MKKLSIGVILLSLLFTISACNTIEGIGKDVKKAGEKVEGAAKK